MSQHVAILEEDLPEQLGKTIKAVLHILTNTSSVKKISQLFIPEYEYGFLVFDKSLKSDLYGFYNLTIFEVHIRDKKIFQSLKNNYRIEIVLKQGERAKWLAMVFNIYNNFHKELVWLSRVSYLLFVEGFPFVEGFKEGHIERYLLNDLVMREVCEYMIVDDFWDGVMTDPSGGNRICIH